MSSDPDAALADDLEFRAGQQRGEVITPVITGSVPLENEDWHVSEQIAEAISTLEKPSRMSHRAPLPV